MGCIFSSSNGTFNGIVATAGKRALEYGVRRGFLQTHHVCVGIDGDAILSRFNYDADDVACDDCATAVLAVIAVLGLVDWYAYVKQRYDGPKVDLERWKEVKRRTESKLDERVSYLERLQPNLRIVFTDFNLLAVTASTASRAFLSPFIISSQSPCGFPIVQLPLSGTSYC